MTDEATDKARYQPTPAAAPDQCSERDSGNCAANPAKTAYAARLVLLRQLRLALPKLDAPALPKSITLGHFPHSHSAKAGTGARA
jgi:hypothetical protein